jgi:peroxiredoxin
VRLRRALFIAATTVGSISCAPSTIDIGARAPAPARALSADGQVTVLLFFSAKCPCQRAHDARLVALADRYSSRGVRFVAVDSEAGADEARDGAEAASRSYPFAIVSDPDGAVAEALGVDVATTAVVIDAQGRVRYRGGIDSDRHDLHINATPFLSNALDALLAGRDPEKPTAKSLGCILQRR